MNEYPEALPRIRCVGANQGEANQCSRELYYLRNRLSSVSRDRSRWMLVVIGTSAWTRRDDSQPWEFVEFCFDYLWPWLFKSLPYTL